MHAAQRRGGLLDVMGLQVRGREPREVGRPVPRARVIEPGEHGLQHGHGAQWPAQLRPAAARHDVDLGFVDPPHPVRLGAGVGAVQRFLARPSAASA
ncbi:MAG TPA: hypothetical protein VGL46_09275 [Pseudonocardiaceae bacterium]